MGNIVNSANLSVADARRGDIIRRVTRQLDSLEREIGRGSLGAGGVPSAYLAERLEFLKGEAERLQQEIARLSALAGEELIREMVPSIAQREAMADEPVASLHDVISQRGAMLPQQVIVSRQTLPSRHEGPQTAPAVPQGLPKGFVPGQVHTPDPVWAPQ